MNRADSPIIYLAATRSPSPRRSKSRVKFFDYVFLTLAITAVAGGCLWILDTAAARSHGHESLAMQFMSQAEQWLPQMLSGTFKSVLFALAGVVNLALIIGLVQGLRVADRHVNRISKGYRLCFVDANQHKVQSIRRETLRVKARGRETSPFLLSPVFR